MRLFSLLAALLVVATSALSVASAQSLEFVDTATFPTTFLNLGGSDVWGYTAPDGTDYALYGVRDGVAVVQVPSMQVIDVVPGPKSADFYFHRDMVAHGHYAYAVSECFGVNEGLQVIDLSGLPASVSLVNVHTDGVVSSHNMDVDAGTGFLYVLDGGANGIYFIDPSDPQNLVNVHYLSLPDVHDVHARNDTLWVAEGYNPTFSMWDVSNKTNPQLLTRVTIPNSGYVHNIWPTDDSRYVMTTEETANKTVKVWDVQDVGNVSLVGQYLAPNNLAHNVHIQGDYAFISHYESGVVVVDISDPPNPVEVDRYDTYPGGEGPNFNGNWGATVPSPSGYVYGGDFDGKLTVLRFLTGSSAVAAGIAPVGGPITIPAGGGTFQFTASLTNTTAQPQAVDAWVSATLPNGSPYGPVFGPQSVTVPSGGTVTRTLTASVPGRAPGGIYTLRLSVGDYPAPDATDSFTFTKAPSRLDGATADAPLVIASEGFFAFADGVEASASAITPRAATALGIAAQPNPFRESSTIRFALDVDASVRLSLHDALGREVLMLAEGLHHAGAHAYFLDGSALPSGLYLVRLAVDGRTETRRVSLLR